MSTLGCDTDTADHVCPACQSNDVERAHFAGNAAVPETSYFYCCNCNHQWGHE